MSHRSNSVLVYKDRLNRLYCRIGIIGIITNKCILCSNNCVDGISRCRYNIKKYIDIFVDKIDKVEAR